jgi:hypothetical protein
MLLAGTARVACGVSELPGLAGWLAGWLVSSSSQLEVLRRRPRFREAKPRGSFNSISRFLLIDFRGYRIAHDPTKTFGTGVRSD